MSLAHKTRSLAHLARRGLRKIENCGWELWLRTSTRGITSIQTPDAHDYATISYAGINSILRHLAPSCTDVFVDIGCGKGRLVCCAARYLLAGVYGLDISPTLCTIAQRNAKRLRGRRTPVTIVTADTQKWDYGNSTILFLFNPFRRETLGRVLARVRDSLQAHPRASRLVYVIPECESTLPAAGWELVERWSPRPSVGLDYPVTFWCAGAASPAGTCDHSAGAIPVLTDALLRSGAVGAQ